MSDDEAPPLAKSAHPTWLYTLTEVARNLCPTTMLEYTKAQENQKSPLERKPLSDKLLTCYQKGVDGIVGTPCEALTNAYQACLANDSYYKFSECRHFQDKLGMCVVKHVQYEE